jgi:rare lipoprotein A (peptidoglycan hydrolase)
MPQSLGVRASLLAGLTLAAAVIAFAVARETRHGSAEKLPAPAGGWYHALAAPYPEAPATRGACGVVIDSRTLGVANPVLPCGVKIYLSYGGRQALAQVVDRGPQVPGRYFDVTRALAKKLGLSGTRTVAWRFAR